MNKLLKLSFLSLAVSSLIVLLDSCKPQPPEVIIIPDPPTKRNVIDNYYFVKFGWGGNKSEDTIVMEVPDDTLGTDTSAFEWNLERDFAQATFDYRHEFIRDTTNLVEVLEDGEYVYAAGYHYAPANFFYSRGLEEHFRSGNASAGSMEEAYNKGDLNLAPINFGDEEDAWGEERYHRNIFHIAFPTRIDNDTLPYWDIEDYIYNPNLKEGSVKWGRVGTQKMRIDTLILDVLNQNAVEGVLISYIDEFQVEWRTDNYPNFQNGSYFQLNDISLNQRDMESYWVVEGEFAATLYNEIGESRKCKAGEFRMRIISDVELAPQPE